MKGNRALEAFRRANPVEVDRDDLSSLPPEALRVRDAILASGQPPRPRRLWLRPAPRVATALVVVLLLIPATYGLWLAFGPLLSDDPTGSTDPAGSPTGAPPIVSTSPTPTPEPSSSEPTSGSTPPAPRYEANATVLQAKNEPAMLCLGGIALSLPPQCGEMPITNWSWDRAGRHEQFNGARWGDFHLVGTYDGESFTVLEVGPPRDDNPQPSDGIDIPCPEPEGGWVASDPSRASDADLRAGLRYARAQPDSAGGWLKHTEPFVDTGADGPYGPNEIVLNAAFTGDLDRHRAELVKLWGGPLCVVQYERTEAELTRIQDELTGKGPEEFGYTLLFASTDIVRNQVEIGVVVVDAELRQAIDDRYGEGVVRLVPALTPID